MPTVRIPVSSDNNQPTTYFSGKFAYRLNVMDEKYQGKTYTVKRPGLSLQTSIVPGPGQGMTNYNNVFYTVINDVLYGSAATGNFGSSGATWTASANAPWSIRAPAQVVNFNDTLIVMGGFNGNLGIYYNDVWQTFDGVNWSLLTSSPPWAGRGGFSAQVLNGTIFIIGGQTISGDVMNDIWSSTDGANWTQVTAAAAFPARTAMGSLVSGNAIYIFGGRNLANNPLADIWQSTDGSTWNQLQINGVSWPARSHMAVFYLFNGFFVVGGLAAFGNALNDCWFSPNGQTWVQLSAAVFPSARYAMGYTIYHQQMFIAGGFDTTDTPQAGVFSSLNGSTWSTVTLAAGFGAKGYGLLIPYKTPTSVSPFRYVTMWFLGGISAGPTYNNSVYYSTLDINLSLVVSLSPATAGQPFQFNSFKEGTVLLVKNQSGLWVLDATGIHQVMDANYPTVTVPGIVVMGKWMYVMNPQGRIQNSGFDDPYTWPTLNVVFADYADDPGVAIAKYSNYLVAFGTYSIQFFYDAGLSPGSPLAPYLNSNIEIGCAYASSIAELGSTIVWVSQTKQLTRQVMVFNGLQPTPISNTYIDKMLSDAAITNVNGIAMGVEGHLFYILTFTDSNSVNQSWAYDFTSKQWGKWALAGDTQFLFAGYASNFLPQGYFLLGATDGNIYNVSINNAIDFNAPFTVTLQTDSIDGGNNRTKFWGQFEVICDRNPGTPTIEYTDDDYQNYSTPRTVFPSTPRPVLYRNGASRKRAIRYTQTDVHPMRIEAFETTYEQGN